MGRIIPYIIENKNVSPLSAPLPKWDTQLRPYSCGSDSPQIGKRTPCPRGRSSAPTQKKPINSLKHLLATKKPNRTPETTISMTSRSRSGTATSHIGVTEVRLYLTAKVLAPDVQTDMVRQLCLGA
jgi:hypothetical protein